MGKGRLPNIYPGRWYGVFCKDVSNKSLMDFVDVLRFLYSDDPSTLVIQEYHAKKKKGGGKSVFTFVSVPLGDVCFMPRLRAHIPEWFFGKGKNFEHPNVFLLIPYNEQYDPAVGAHESFEAGDYKALYTKLQSICRESASAMFLSISIRLRRNKEFPNSQKQLEEDTAAYLEFHVRENGIECHQYGIARTLNAIVMYNRDKSIEAAEILEDQLIKSLECVQKISYRDFVYYILGTIQFRLGKEEVGMENLKQSSPYRYADIGSLFFPARFDLAFGFLMGAYKNIETRTDLVVQRLAHVLCKIGVRPAARSVLCSILPYSETQKHMLPKTETSDKRICYACHRISDMSKMQRFPDCKEHWACNTECMGAVAEKHNKYCRVCYGCNKKISLKSQRQFCIGCFLYFYCDEDCQLVHWKAGHNKECHSKK